MARPKKSNVGNGFEKKPRTLEQITQEYNQQCVLAGHKSRLLQSLNQDINRLEDEVKQHLDSAHALNNEGAKLQAALKLAAMKPTEAPVPAPMAQVQHQEAPSAQPN